MKPSATLVLTDHRPEVIPLAQKLMAAHDTVILEEPVAANPLHRFENSKLINKE